MLKFLFPILLHLIQKLKQGIFNIIRSRWMVSFFLFFVLVTSSVYTANNFYVYEMKKKYINLYRIKNSITKYVKMNMNRAIILGIVDFSMLDGITFDDIKISNEEDFSNNKLLFTSQRVDVKLSSILEKNIYLSKVTVHNSNIELDLNEISSEQIIQYFRESKFPQIEFKNLNFTIKNGNRELIRTQKPIRMIVKKIDEELFFEFDDSYINIPFFRGMFGTGSYDAEGRFHLDIRFNDYSLKYMNGILTELIDSKNSEGKGEGFIKFSTFKGEMNLEGDLNLFNYSGDIGIIPNLELKSISMNTKFSYFKESVEDNKTEIYFKRKISNPAFYYSDNIFVNRENLKKIQIDANIEDFSKITPRISSLADNTITGKIKVNFLINETGKANDWFTGDGIVSISNMNINLKDLKFSMFIDKLDLIYNQKSEINSNVTGTIFSTPFQLVYKSVLNHAKLKNQKVDYQFYHTGVLDFNIDRVNLFDFKQIYESISNFVKEEIRERQEKMLPDTYVIGSPYYKMYFEKLILDTNLNINDLYKNNTSSKIGKVKLNLKLYKGAINLDIYDELNDKKGNDINISLRGSFDKKMPYYEFKVAINELQWNDHIMEFCGANFRADTISINLNSVASGNNFSDLIVTRSYNGDFVFKNIFFEQYDTIDNINLQEYLGSTGNIEIKGLLQGYSQDVYVRNLEIASPAIIFRGNTNSNYSRGGGVNFNLYGSQNGKPIVLNFVEKKNKCGTNKK